jgi:hypothetical protein
VSLTDRKKHLSAFTQIISIFQELFHAGGGLEEIKYNQTRLAAPSISDFTCDVELAARRCLTPNELSYFNEFYKSGHVAVSKSDTGTGGCWFTNGNYSRRLQKQLAELDQRVREKLGRALLSSGIAPLNAYLTPVGDAV